MTDPAPPAAVALPSQVVQVFAARDIYATAGANIGDTLAADGGRIDLLAAGDVYMLDPDAAPAVLALAAPGGGGGQVIAAGSEVGRRGAAVHLLGQLTLMAPDGDRVTLLLLTPEGGEVFALPMVPMAAQVDYTLLQAEAAPPDARLADLVCLSFARGTHIMRATGQQAPIEALVPGDRVLTRDHGVQEVRWIGQTTLRARGQFAPVVIPAGTMGNMGDLVVGPHHRLFLYLRERPEGVATAEILVQARHLVDPPRIFRREGGFVDYFSLVFDRHEIIYAEGIPVESLIVNAASVARLPEDLAEAVRRAFPALSQRPHFGTEAGPAMVDRLRLK